MSERLKRWRRPLIRAPRVEQLEARQLLATLPIAQWRADDLNATHADGTVVSEWIDSVGAVRAAAGGEPQLVQNVLDGHSVLRFNRSDGVDTFLVAANDNPVSGATDFTLAVVFATGSQLLNGGQSLWFLNTGLVDATGFFGTTADWGLVINANGEVGAGLGGPAQSVYSSASGLNDGNFHVAVYAKRGDRVELYVDRQAADVLVGASTAPRVATEVMFGAITGGSLGYIGDLAEIRFYDQALSPEDVADTISDLQNRYSHVPPQAADDQYMVDEDRVLQVPAATGVLANDLNVEDDLLTARLVGPPEHGIVLFDSDGGFRYEPHSDYSGLDRFLYLANNTADSELATVEIDVQPLYDPPRVLGDNYVAAANERFTILADRGLLANDSHADSLPLSVEVLTEPRHGDLSWESDGGFDFRPADGFLGEDEFTYRASDGVTTSETVTVTLEVVSKTVRISELQASNGITLLDQDGDTPDWLELENLVSRPTDLSDWYLTDDRQQLDKWRFPVGTILPPEGRLVVFASGKDRPDADELHTNFQFSNEGEFVALVAADGATVVNSLGQWYPPQAVDVSYGPAAPLLAEEPLVTAETPLAVLLPDLAFDAAVGANWKTPEFIPDAHGEAWRAGRGATGFDTGAPQWETLAEYDAAQAGGSFLLLDPTRQGWTLTQRNDPRLSAGPVRDDLSQGIAAWRIEDGTSSQGEWRYDFQQSALEAASARQHGWEFSASVRLVAGDEPTHSGHLLQVGDGTQRFAIELRLDSAGNLIARNLSVTSSNTKITTDGNGSAEYHEIMIRYDPRRDRATLWIDGTVINDDWRGQASSHSGVLWGASSASGQGAAHYRSLSYRVNLEGGLANYEQLGLVETNLRQEMFGQTASAYVRIPFDVSQANPLETYQGLRLRLQYDDGFVAYLNDQEVARQQAPGSSGESPPFNARATARRSDKAALQVSEYDLSGGIATLRPGAANVLAIHALNGGVLDSDLLLSAELVALRAPSSGHFYMTAPTPGEANAPGFVSLLAEPTVEPRRGLYTAADLEPGGLLASGVAFHAAPGTPADAVLYYTIDGSVPDPDNPSAIAYAGPISITTTTPLRVAAHRPGFAASPTLTETYLFGADVAQQSGAGLPPLNGTDYEIDAEIVNDPRFVDLEQSLRSLPSLSFVLPVEDIWGPNGIYENPNGRGREWERAASIELLLADGTPGFQVDAGLRIQGAGSRDRTFSKKNFQLFFRNEYGDPQLEYPFFGPDRTDAFDRLVLRGNFFDSWTFNTAGTVGNVCCGYNQALLFRDHVGHRTLSDMGNLAVASNWAHLYINGQYWGVYSPIEQPDEHFAESYLGGAGENYDVLKHRLRGQANGSPPEIVHGNRVAWEELMALVQQDTTDDAVYRQIADVVDLEKFIDYLLMNFHAGNRDWPHNNFYAVRERTEGARWQFIAWDVEVNLFSVNQDVTGVSTFNSPGVIYARLRLNPEFRLLFADRVQEHFFNGGALTTEQNLARFESVVAELEAAMTGESARWGDTHIEPPRNPIDHWQVVVEEKRNHYIPQRNAIVLEQFRGKDLLSTVDAPAFNQHGGDVPSGFLATLSHPAPAAGDLIYLTSDGSDPRLPGGGVGASAEVYADPLAITGDTTLRARVLRDGVWSAVTTARFQVGTAATLRVSEVHFHPADPTPEEMAAGHNSDGDFEFLELVNIGQAAVDLAGVALVEVGGEGVRFEFPEEQLEPGDRLVVVENVAAFRDRYGEGPRVAGEWQGGLSNGSEQLTLVGSGGVIQQFTYRDWYAATDGGGASLEILHAGAPDLSRWSDATAWQPGSLSGGTPGEAARFLGDVDQNGAVDARDIDAVFAAIGQGDQAPQFDITGDQRVDRDDVDTLVHNLLQTDFGDVDLDGSIMAGADGRKLIGNLGRQDVGWDAGDFDGDRRVSASTDGAIFLAALARDQAKRG